jgi:hypothetical protein
MGRQKVIKRKAEPSRARRNRARQKERSPTVEPFLASNPNMTMSPEPIPTTLSNMCARVKVDVVMPKILMRVLPEPGWYVFTAVHSSIQPFG